MAWLTHIAGYDSTISSDKDPIHITDIKNSNKYWKCSIHHLQHTAVCFETKI